MSFVAAMLIISEMSSFGHSYVNRYYATPLHRKTPGKNEHMTRFFQAFGSLPVGQGAP